MLLSLYVVRFLIAFTVVVHLNGMILSLRIESAAQRGIQRQITYAKLRLYQSFRAIFLAYLLLPVRRLWSSKGGGDRPVFFCCPRVGRGEGLALPSASHIALF